MAKNMDLKRKSIEKDEEPSSFNIWKKWEDVEVVKEPGRGTYDMYQKGRDPFLDGIRKMRIAEEERAAIAIKRWRANALEENKAMELKQELQEIEDYYREKNLKKTKKTSE